LSTCDGLHSGASPCQVCDPAGYSASVGGWDGLTSPAADIAERVLAKGLKGREGDDGWAGRIAKNDGGHSDSYDESQRGRPVG